MRLVLNRRRGLQYFHNSLSGTQVPLNLQRHTGHGFERKRQITQINNKTDQRAYGERLLFNIGNTEIHDKYRAKIGEKCESCIMHQIDDAHL